MLAALAEILGSAFPALGRQQPRPPSELGLVRRHLSPEVKQQPKPTRRGHRRQGLPKVLRKRGRGPRNHLDVRWRFQGEHGFELLRPQHIAGCGSECHRSPAALADRLRRCGTHSFSRCGPEQRDEEPGAVTKPVGLLNPKDP